MKEDLITIDEALKKYQKAVNKYLSQKEQIDKFFINEQDVIETIIATRLNIPKSTVNATIWGVDITFDNKEEKI